MSNSRTFNAQKSLLYLPNEQKPFGYLCRQFDRRLRMAMRVVASWRIARRGPGRPAAHLVLKPQSPDHKKGLADNVARHLGVTLEAIGKNDGHLDYFHP